MDSSTKEYGFPFRKSVSEEGVSVVSSWISRHAVARGLASVVSMEPDTGAYLCLGKWLMSVGRAGGE